MTTILLLLLSLGATPAPFAGALYHRFGLELAFTGSILSQAAPALLLLALAALAHQRRQTGWIASLTTPRYRLVAGLRVQVFWDVRKGGGDHAH